MFEWAFGEWQKDMLILAGSYVIFSERWWRNRCRVLICQKDEINRGPSRSKIKLCENSPNSQHWLGVEEEAATEEKTILCIVDLIDCRAQIRKRQVKQRKQRRAPVVRKTARAAIAALCIFFFVKMWKCVGLCRCDTPTIELLVIWCSGDGEENLWFRFLYYCGSRKLKN